MHSKEEIFSWLSVIADPEIPVVSIEEMGMLRNVAIAEDVYEIILTPTYTGCPAMGIIEADIIALLHEKGLEKVAVKMIYDPAWTTDWMSESAKEKMRKYGIAPPVHSSCGNLAAAEKNIACPLCSSIKTEMLSRFGATACKSYYKCNDCKETFEYFKCH